ncbi:hypothetical protein GCM10018954_077310 [Kutzneria kofuensis]
MFPGVEDRADRQVHLLTRLLRERPARVLLHDLLEHLDQLPQVVRVEVQVACDALGLLRLVDRVLEVLAVNVQHRLAEHLDEAAIGVECKPLVPRLLRQAVHRLVVQAHVEDGFHHARHRVLGAAAHRYQQRVRGVAELLAHGLFQLGELLRHLIGQAVRELAVGQVGQARLGGDGEARRHRQAQPRHLAQVGPLAAEQVLHVLVGFGEGVDELGHFGASSAWATDRPVLGRNPRPAITGGRANTRSRTASVQFSIQLAERV